MKPVLVALYSSSMRSGKSTVASMLTERLIGVTHSFAEPLYRLVISIATPFLGSEEHVRLWLSDDRKDHGVIPELGVTLRHMLQTLGTTWGRDCVHRDLWVLLARKKAGEALKRHSVIFDDMRFPNEFEMVKQAGGFCIRIDRPGEARGDTSIGEGLLDRNTFDATIRNDGSLFDLRMRVWGVMEELMLPKTSCCNKTVTVRCVGCPHS